MTQLTLQESFAFSFEFLGATSFADLITVNQEMHLSNNCNNFIDNVILNKEIAVKIALVKETKVIDKTVCDTDKAIKVDLTKEFITFEGVNIIIEKHFFIDYTFVSYTFLENDYNKICNTKW